MAPRDGFFGCLQWLARVAGSGVRGGPVEAGDCCQERLDLCDYKDVKRRALILSALLASSLVGLLAAMAAFSSGPSNASQLSASTKRVILPSADGVESDPDLKSIGVPVHLDVSRNPPRVPPAGRSASTPTAASNKRLAERTAQHLLEEVPLPAGATRVGSDESELGNLTAPASSPQHTPQFVGKHDFWRLEGEPEAAIGWIDEHLPAGSKITERGTSGKAEPPPPRSLRGLELGEYVREHTVTTGWDTIFAFPPSRERLATVWLSVSVSAANGDGSAMRADALVVWRQPRPASEHIPRSVTAVSVKVRDPRKHIHFTRRITNAAKVQKIVAVVEGLQRPETGASSCPADNGKEPIIDLSFRRQDEAPPLVRVRINDNGCGAVSFEARAGRQPYLGEAVQATHQLRRILGGRL